MTETEAPTCSYAVLGKRSRTQKTSFLLFQLTSEAADCIKQPLLPGFTLTTKFTKIWLNHTAAHESLIQPPLPPPLLLKEGQHNNVAAQSINTTGYTPVELDQCKRTCGQYEGLRGSLGERGRGVVAVPAVWVKKVRGQMRSKVNYWPRRKAKRSAVIWRQKGKNVKCYIICLHIVTLYRYSLVLFGVYRIIITSF